MPLSQEFRAAIDLISDVCSVYRQATNLDIVLVGGASATIYTSGAFPSGDFDLIATNDAAFDQAMRQCGFKPETRPGMLKIGYHHPDHDAFGFQQVAGTLFDGRSDQSKLVHFELTAERGVTLPSVEDMIADRLGQHAIASPTDPSRLRQACTMHRLAKHIDEAYLQRRIAEEGGDFSLLGPRPKRIRRASILGFEQ